MDTSSRADDVDSPPRRQFSLRALFKLTLVVSLLLTVGVIYSPWLAISIAIVFAVWLLDRTRLVAVRWLAIASIGLYGISMLLPAVSLQVMGSAEMFLGWQAFYISFGVIPEVFREGWPWNEPDDIEWAVAYLVGAAANVAFLIGFVGYLFSVKFPKARTFARRAAVVATALVVVDFAVMLFADGMRGFYPGFGVWAAGMLALALGTRRP